MADESTSDRREIDLALSVTFKEIFHSTMLHRLFVLVLHLHIHTEREADTDIRKALIVTREEDS